MMRKWLDSTEVIDNYNDGNHRGIDIGIQRVDPSKIIALGLDYTSIKNDYRMNKLKELVNKNGWNDPDPNSLGLTQLPTGEYAVQPGGNHRAVLANERGEKMISAKVYRLYHVSIFPLFIIEAAYKLNEEKNHVEAYLGTLDTSSEDFFDKVTRLDEIDEEVDQLYYDYVKNNGLI